MCFQQKSSPTSSTSSQASNKKSSSLNQAKNRQLLRAQRVYFFIFIYTKILSFYIFIFFTSFFGGRKLGVKAHSNLELDIIDLVGEPVKSTRLIVNQKNNQYKILVGDLKKSTEFLYELV